MKELKCRDVGFDCRAVVRGDTTAGVMARIRPHAQEVHGVHVTPEMAEQLRGLVREI